VGGERGLRLHQAVLPAHRALDATDGPRRWKPGAKT
jgi:hypothetical protein